MLHWFLPYNNPNKSLLLLSLPLKPPSHPSMSSWSARLCFLCCILIAASHYLSVLYLVVYICQCYSLNLSYLFLPHCVHKSVFYFYIPIPALQIGSSIPFFSKFSIYVLINSSCFSLSDLTSLCVTGSSFIYLTTTDSDSFLFMAE